MVPSIERSLENYALMASLEDSSDTTQPHMGGKAFSQGYFKLSRHDMCMRLHVLATVIDFRVK